MSKYLLAIPVALALLTSAGPVNKTVSVTQGTNVNVTLSPDRKTIVMDLQEALWSLPVAGGKAKRLTDPFLEPSRPDWSPKGDLVAFQSFKTGTFHIWAMKPDGTGVRQITEGHADDREPKFSPDGKKIAFSSDRAFQGNYDIWVVDIETGKLTQWTDAPTDEFEPAWSPDGTQIAFVNGTGAAAGGGPNAAAPTPPNTIQSITATGDRKTLITSAPNSRVNAPAWGTKLAYTQFTAGKTRLMLDGQPIGKASEGIGNDVFPFTPIWLAPDKLLYTGDGQILVSTLDGVTKQIPFQADFPIKRADYKRRILDFDTLQPKPVKGILAPAISPDGESAVFEALNQLWLMPFQTGKPTPLTNDNFYKHAPAWSPDGTKIAFSSDKAGTADIYVLNLATKAETRITKFDDSAEINPVWSPDGTKIAFQKQSGTVFLADLATGAVTEAIPSTTYEPGRPSFFQNGNVLSLAVLRPYTRRFREGTSLIATVDLTTRKVTLTEPAPYKSVTTRGLDGPLYSPDGTKLAFVMDGYLWTRPVDAAGLPTGEARPINEEITDAPSWSADGKRMLYLSNGKLRLIDADGRTPPTNVVVNFTWHREASTKTTLIHAGRFWNGLGPAQQTNIDVTVVGRRITSVQPHTAAAHAGKTVIDATNQTLIPGLWESHNHAYGGLDNYGDRAGRIWLSYGFTSLQGLGDGAYGQMEIKESFASGARVGPRYFATGEPIDGERDYYAGNHLVTNERELNMELDRAKALEYDNLKTYVRLPNELQQKAMAYAHEKLGIWTASHYGLPGLAYGMDGMTHVSATSRWGYSYTRSYGGVSYGDIRTLFAAANEFIVSTPFAAAALYAEDKGIVDDPRIATLNTPWAQKAMQTARDRALFLNDANSSQLDNLRTEQETLQAVLHTGGTVVLGTDSPLAGLAILNHLGLRAEVKYGMKPWEALQTATLLPARAFGYGKDLGSIEPGKLADLVIVEGNPLEDIKDAARVKTVIVDGRAYTPVELRKPYSKP